MFNLLAHAGEVHESATESTGHLLSDPMFLWLILALAPFVILFFCLTVFKIKLPTALLILCVFLIIYGVFSYRTPGIYTAVALSLGFGIVFVTTILGISSEKGSS